LELIDRCKYKWKFFEHIYQYKTSYAIESSLSSSYELLKEEFGLPFLLKPRRGFGSKGIVIVANEDDFKPHQQYCGSILMAQRFVGNENEEYTTSAFCDGEGGFFASMTLKRKLSKDGFTDKAEVVQNDGITEAIKDLCRIFRPLGPTNFQFRLHKGEFKLLEINPRISSSTSIRTSFGYNESLMAAEFYLEHKEPDQPIVKQGKAIRFVEDLIIYK
jgi:carbamoyl-phosphate synthase large subunit